MFGPERSERMGSVHLGHSITPLICGAVVAALGNYPNICAHKIIHKDIASNASLNLKAEAWALDQEQGRNMCKPVRWATCE